MNIVIGVEKNPLDTMLSAEVRNENK